VVDSKRATDSRPLLVHDCPLLFFDPPRAAGDPATLAGEGSKAGDEPRLEAGCSRSAAPTLSSSPFTLNW
jgi:hypothetical protein